MYLAGLLDLQLWSYQLLGNKGKQKTKPLLRSASFNNGTPTCMSTALQGRPHAGSNGSYKLDSRETGGWNWLGGEVKGERIWEVLGKGNKYDLKNYEIIKGLIKI